MPFAPGGNGGGIGKGFAFLLSAGVVFELVALACSSPQTAEINIRKREETLMKWVHIGQVLGALFIGAAAYWDKPYRTPILVGGGSAMVTVEAMYIHAKQAGLAKPGPETEQY